MKRVKMIKILCEVAILGMGIQVRADEVAAKAEGGKIHYKSGKDVNFDELLIQGQLKRPEVSVVTGNVRQGADGLLRLRENFLDRVATDAGEEATP